MSISKIFSLIMFLGTANLIFWFFITDFGIPPEIHKAVFNSQKKIKPEPFLFQQYQPAEIQVKLNDEQIAKLISNKKIIKQVNSLSASLNKIKNAKSRQVPLFPMETAEIGKIRAFPKINFYPAKNQVKLLLQSASKSINKKDQKQTVKYYTAAYVLAQSIEHMSWMKKPYLSTTPQLISISLKKDILTSISKAIEKNELSSQNSKQLANALKPLFKKDLDFEFYLKTYYAEYQYLQYSAMMEFMTDNFDKQGRLYEWCLFFLYEAYKKTILLQQTHLKNELNLIKKSTSYNDLAQNISAYRKEYEYSMMDNIFSKAIVFVAGVIYPKYILTELTNDTAKSNCTLAFLFSNSVKPFETLSDLKEELLIYE